MTKTVVALYDDASVAQDVVRELLNNGFRRDDVSIVASDARGEVRTGHATEEGTSAAAGGAGVGAVLGGLAGLLVGLGALAIPGVGPIIAAGPLAATLAGAGIGAVTGGLIGALVEAGVPENEARHYEEGVRRGGTLVTVHASDDMAERARDLMNRHGAVDINTRAQEWGSSTGYGTTEGSMRPDTMGSERSSTRYTGAAMPSETRTTGSTGTMGTGSGSMGTSRTGREETTETTTGGGFGTQYTGGGQWSGTGGYDFETYEPDFRHHYDTSFMNSGYSYNQYLPAYQYGHTLRNDERYRDRNWEDIQMDARRDWEDRHPNTWERFRDAIRYAWERR